MDNLNFLDSNEDITELLYYIESVSFIENTNNLIIPKKNTVTKTSLKCLITNCEKMSRYGFIQNKPLYCRLHKDIRMHNVLSRKCEYDKCMIQPSFGYLYGKIQYCKKHSKPNMINLKSKLCIEYNCNSRSVYGYIYHKPLFCKQHSLNNMINVYYKK